MYERFNALMTETFKEYGANVETLFDTDPENTWVFTGGKAVQSDYHQTKGMRNYVGHYEEYIRYDQPSRIKKQPEEDYAMQRYVFNIAKSGITIMDLVHGFDEYVDKYRPKAVAYLLGEEDYCQKADGINRFKKYFKQFVDKVLDKNRFFIFQTAYPVQLDSVNDVIIHYNVAALEVLKTFEQEKSHILVVDFYTPNNTDTFQKDLLHKNGCLNAKGHFEIGKQLSLATVGSIEGYPGKNVTLDLVETCTVEQYLSYCAHVIYENGKLSIMLPQEVCGYDFKYTLSIDNRKIEGFIHGKCGQIAVESDVNYELVLQDLTGKQQLPTLYGRTVPNQVAVVKSLQLTGTQAILHDKLKSKEPMTWLFMGDSITHGALWTFGYDGVVQLFEKYLRHDLNRENDIVLNTAVSGATTQSTLDHIQQRLDNYTADVIVLMIGTNDANRDEVTIEQYAHNLQQLIDKAREKEAIIVLRSPTPTTWGQAGKYIDAYVAVMRQIVRHNPGVIYSEQLQPMGKLFQKYPYLYRPEFSMMTDGFPLHPGPYGHVLMVQYLIKDLGLKTQDSYIYNMTYQMPYIEQMSDIVPNIQRENDTMRFDCDAFKLQTALDIEDVVLCVRNVRTNQTETVIGENGFLETGKIDVMDLYEVSIHAYLKQDPIILKTEKQII